MPGIISRRRASIPAGIALSMLLAAALAPTLGCDGRSRRASARLRTANTQLEAQVESLTSRVDELKAAVSRAETETNRRDGALAHAPLVTTLSVSSMSGFEPGSSADTTIAEVHVGALDGRHRPVQLVGTLEVQLLRPVAGGDPLLLARTTLDAGQVRDAWRQALIGPTYLAPVELTRDALPDDGPVIVHVFHEDARTGRRLEAIGALNRSSTEPAGQH